MKILLNRYANQFSSPLFKFDSLTETKCVGRNSPIALLWVPLLCLECLLFTINSVFIYLQCLYIELNREIALFVVMANRIFGKKNYIKEAIYLFYVISSPFILPSCSGWNENVKGRTIMSLGSTLGLITGDNFQNLKTSVFTLIFGQNYQPVAILALEARFCHQFLFRKS